MWILDIILGQELKLQRTFKLAFQKLIRPPVPADKTWYEKFEPSISTIVNKHMPQARLVLPSRMHDLIYVPGRFDGLHALPDPAVMVTTNNQFFYAEYETEISLYLHKVAATSLMDMLIYRPADFKFDATHSARDPDQIIAAATRGVFKINSEEVKFRQVQCGATFKEEIEVPMNLPGIKSVIVKHFKSKGAYATFVNGKQTFIIEGMWQYEIVMSLLLANLGNLFRFEAQTEGDAANLTKN